jgi:hypothetical protein
LCAAQLKGGDIEVKATGVVKVNAGANGKIVSAQPRRVHRRILSLIADLCLRVRALFQSAAAKIRGAGALQVATGGNLGVQAPVSCESAGTSA